MLRQGPQLAGKSLVGPTRRHPRDEDLWGPGRGGGEEEESTPVFVAGLEKELKKNSKRSSASSVCPPPPLPTSLPLPACTTHQ